MRTWRCGCDACSASTVRSRRSIRTAPRPRTTKPRRRLFAKSAPTKPNRPPAFLPSSRSSRPVPSPSPRKPKLHASRSAPPSRPRRMPQFVRRWLAAVRFIPRSAICRVRRDRARPPFRRWRQRRLRNRPNLNVPQCRPRRPRRLHSLHDLPLPCHPPQSSRPADRLRPQRSPFREVPPVRRLVRDRFFPVRGSRFRRRSPRLVRRRAQPRLRRPGRRRPRSVRRNSLRLAARPRPRRPARARSQASRSRAQWCPRIQRSPRS